MATVTTRAWLPLALSLAVHGLLVLAGTMLSAGTGAHADGPVPIDTRVLVDGDGVTVLDFDPPGRPGKRAAPRPKEADDEEPSEVIAASVGELPVVAPPPPHTVAHEPAADAGGGAAGHGEADGSAGGAGVAGVLRAPAAARNVVFVVDRSISMGLSGALAVAKRELLAGIGALPPSANFQVLLYNGRAEPLVLAGQAGLLAATAENRRAAVRAVEDTPANGKTDHLAALRRAVGLGADVIFFVTDADELHDDQVRNVTALNGGRAVIHTVELNNDGERREETPLKLLARLNGGTHRVLAVGR